MSPACSSPLPSAFTFSTSRSAWAAPVSFSVAAAVDAILWMFTTGIAMAFMLKGKVQQHRQCMTRSFAVAIVFLEGRVVAGVTGWEVLGEHAVETIVWGCLAFSLLFADVVLQLQELLRNRRALQELRPLLGRLPRHPPWPGIKAFWGCFNSDVSTCPPSHLRRLYPGWLYGTERSGPTLSSVFAPAQREIFLLLHHPTF